MESNYRLMALRQRLVSQLREKGVTDEKVLMAINEVPRHSFMDTAFVDSAYVDKAFPIDAGQTISQPFTVAMQTQLLEVSPRERVLEIGTGSGYQCAVLCQLGAKVFSIERQKTLYLKSSRLLSSMGYRPKLFYGDGYKGKAGFGPYDKIIITCGAPYIPPALVDQLKPGGIMIIPLGEQEQRMIKLVKDADGQVSHEDHGPYQFVPMLKDKAQGI